MKPLTAEDLAELRRLVPPVARGNLVTLHRTDYERVRELLPLLLDEVECTRAGAVTIRFEDGGKTIGLDEVLQEVVPKMQAEMERARALLKRIEWASVDEDGYGRCPECLGLDPSDPGIAHWPLGAAPVGQQWKGHRPGCELAALLPK